MDNHRVAVQATLIKEPRRTIRPHFRSGVTKTHSPGQSPSMPYPY